jgi:hypothetical protein
VGVEIQKNRRPPIHLLQISISQSLLGDFCNTTLPTADVREPWRHFAFVPQAAVSNRSKPGPYSIEWLDLFRWPRRGSQLPEQHVTMANVFDQFDTPAPNVFNQFDAQTARAAPTLSEMSTEDLLRGYQGTAPAAPYPERRVRW